MELFSRFWSGPIVTIIAMTIMDLWVREKTVVGVENLVAFCGHIFFLVRSTGLHVELSSMPPLVFVAVEYDIVH